MYSVRACTVAWSDQWRRCLRARPCWHSVRAEDGRIYGDNYYNDRRRRRRKLNFSRMRGTRVTRARRLSALSTDERRNTKQTRAVAAAAAAGGKPLRRVLLLRARWFRWRTAVRRQLLLSESARAQRRWFPGGGFLAAASFAGSVWSVGRRTRGRRDRLRYGGSAGGRYGEIHRSWPPHGVRKQSILGGQNPTSSTLTIESLFFVKRFEEKKVDDFEFS